MHPASSPLHFCRQAGATGMKFVISGLSRSSRLLSALVALLSVCALSAAIVAAVGLRHEAREQAEHDIQRLAVVLTEQSARMLDAVDRVLTDIDRDVGLSHLGTPERFRAAMGSEAMQLDLSLRRSGLAQADGLVVIGTGGEIVNSSRVWPPPPFSVADRPYFQAMQAPGAPSLAISAPIASRITGKWIVFVVRRIAAPDGGLLGVLAAAVSLDYLRDFYTALDLPAGTAVTVLRRDGRVLISSPESREMHAEVMPKASAWYATVAAGGGAYWDPDWLDGQARRVGVRPVAGFPVVIDVSMTQSAMDAGWQHKVMALAAGTLCVVVCLLLLLRALVAQFRRLEVAQAALRTKSLLLETTLAHMDQGIIMVTAARTLGVVNGRALKLLDLPAGLMRDGVTLDEVLQYQWDHGEFAGEGKDMLTMLRQGGYLDRAHMYERRRANGTVLEIRSIPLDGGGLVRTFTDITERRLAEAHVLHAAGHDALTGLANRATFTRRLVEAIADAQSDGTGFAVLFFDLDRFKLVNDTLGHGAGDVVLQQVADRMREVVRGSDTLARMGGDEFALVMPGVSEPAAIATADRLRGTIRQPYLLPPGTASIGVSIGIACSPADGATAAELLNHADLALYRAKETGRDACCVFDAALDTDKQGELVLESALQFALQEEQFALVYQPIWDIQAQRIVGAEALVRWHHPLQGIISPASFIPLAERTGLIVELGRWVLETACREAVSWANPINVSVNVAPAQLRRPEIVAEVRNVLASTGLLPSRLKLEITEGQMLEETTAMVAIMSGLRDLGVRLALDDFGTGHSSLSTLRYFPLSEIKIDRSFTQGIVEHDRSRALIEAILHVCRFLNLECVAEGVETEEQLAILKSMGCTHAQGYLIGRPEPPATIRRATWRLAGDGRHEPPKAPPDARVANL
jgi:diguanylate cyclase (GGDEF)-like protein